MSKRNGLMQKLLAFILVLSMAVPFANIGDVFASGYQYHIQINSNGVVAPKATSNPFDVEEGTQINVGVKVADDNGLEIEDEDSDFGDTTPRYSSVVWAVENGAEGIKLKRDKGLVNGLTAVTPGKYYLNLTYPTDSKIEPLRIEVNVTPSATAATRVDRIEPQNQPTRVRVGSSVDVAVKGYNVKNDEVEPSLSVKNVIGGSFVGATATGNTVTVTGKSVGNATVTVNDKDGAQATFNVECYDDRTWDLDTATATLKGFVNKSNTPEAVEIPANIDGNPVKHIAKDAFKFSTTSAKYRNVSQPITSLTLPEGLETTGYMSFQSNDIKSIVIPSSLTELGGRTFFGNKNLANVTFAEGSKLETIGGGAFFQTAVSSVSIPSSVKVIREDAFKETSVKSIEIPEGVTEIGAQAFALNAVEEFTIPSTVTTLNMDRSNPNRPREGQGLFFRNFKDSEKEGVTRFTKVYDKSGVANAINTRGVVNPVPVTIKYQDKTGKDIKASEIVVGHEKNTVETTIGKYNIKKHAVKDGDGHFYTDYVNPFQDIIDVYTKNDFAEKLIGENYFSDNKEYSFKAPFIAGYIAPANVEKTITKSDNEVVFVYADAEKYSLTLNGDGLTADNEKIVEGKPTMFKIHAPEGKEVEKLTLVTTKSVGGQEQSETTEVTKDQLIFDGVDYTYEYSKYGNTVATVAYVDSQLKNELTLDLGKDSIKLGEKLDFDPMYRGKSVSHDKLNISFTENTKNKVKEADKTLVPMDAGTLQVTVSLKDYPEISVTKNVTVAAINTTVRLEDDKNTVLDKTPVVIEKLYLEAGKTYFTNLEFEFPTPILAIEKALREKGVNTALKEEFDCSDSGSWMVLLGKDMWKNINKNGSYMYYVNNKYADKGVGEYVIKENDNIYVYYDPDWQVANAVGYFEKEDYEITAGESAEFTFMGSTFDMNTSKAVSAPIEGAALEIKKDDKVITTEEKTSSEGKISYTFNEPGTYHVSAVSTKTPAEFTRPQATVIVKKPVKMGTVLESTDKSVKVTFPEEIDLIDLELVSENLDKNYDELVSGKYDAKNIFIRNKDSMEEVSVSSLTNGKEVSAEITLGEKLASEDVKLFTEENGKLKAHPSTKEDGKIKFNTSHFSVWVAGVEKQDMNLKEPAEPVKVEDANNLTEEEQNMVKDAIIAANEALGLVRDNIVVSKNGEGTVSKEGYNDSTVAADKTVSEKMMLDVKAPAEKVKVKDPQNLTDEEMMAVKKAVAEANADKNIKESDVTVAKDGTVTVMNAEYKASTLAGDMIVEKEKEENPGDNNQNDGGNVDNNQNNDQNNGGNDQNDDVNNQNDNSNNSSDAPSNNSAANDGAMNSDSMNNQSTDKKMKKTVKTGDESDFAGFAVAMVIAGLGVISLRRKAK